MKILSSTIIMSLLLTLRSFSQEVDFTGEWTLKEKSAVTGPQYANGLPTSIKIHQRKDSLVAEYSYEGTNGLIRLALNINGKQTITKSLQSKRKLVSSCAWLTDRKGLLLTTVFYQPNNEREIDFARIELWVLDGDLLTIDKKSIETNHDTWETKGVFQKL